MKYEFKAFPENATKEQIAEVTKSRRDNLKSAQDQLNHCAMVLVNPESDEVEKDEASSGVREAYEFLTAKRPRAKRGSSARAKISREDVVVQFFGNPENLDRKGQADEVKVFVSTKLGRADVILGLRRALDAAAPADRLWVAFNSEAGIYTLMGRGEAVPAGWTGKLPLAKPVLVEDESAVGPGLANGAVPAEA